MIPWALDPLHLREQYFHKPIRGGGVEHECPVGQGARHRRNLPSNQHKGRRERVTEYNYAKVHLELQVAWSPRIASERQLRS